MATKETILTPGSESCNPVPAAEPTGTALLVENYLGEFDSDQKRQLARTNLDVPSIEEAIRPQDAETMMDEKVKAAIDSHVKDVDPHDILTQVTEILKGYIKADGSIPFTAPVSGKAPQAASDLATREYVDTVLGAHERDMDDPHQTMVKVKEELTKYALSDDVYPKSQTYTQAEVDTMMKNAVKSDGTTPFKVPQKGVYPKSSADLSTKAYVDDVMNAHKSDADAHGFITTLENRLKNYYTKSEVIPANETYTRAQIDSKIESLMTPVIDSAINKHIMADDPHGTLAAVRMMNYVKADGSVPFTARQKGVAGVEQNDLATIGDVDFRVNGLRQEVEESTDSMVWKTSGPVQSTVGFVVDNSEMPARVTFQQMMDAIFYGDGVRLEVPEYAEYGSTVKVVMTVRPTALIQSVDLMQDDKVIGSFLMEDFEPDGQCTAISEPIKNNPTTFKLKVTYTNGNVKTATAQTGIGYGVYVGIMPKWMQGSQMTIDYMNQLCSADPENNKKFFAGEKVDEYRIHYNFQGTELKSLFIAMPVSYKDLSTVYTVTQQFPAYQFECVNNIPFTFPDGKIVMYKIYIFPTGIVELNMDVIYKLA